MMRIGGGSGGGWDARTRCLRSPLRLPLSRGIVVAVAFMLVGALIPGAARAQEALNHATLSGRVYDPSGAVVDGAVVVARQLDTSVTTSATTDRDGRFRLTHLRVGPYELVVSAAGLASDTRRFTATVGAAFDISITLQLAAVQSTVDVAAADTVIEAARSQVAGTVSRVEAASLPLDGRQFLDLALLIPGVVPANVGGTQIFPETSAVPGSGLSIGSQRNLSNNFIVDGLSANDDAAGLAGMTFAVDAIDQFQVVTSGGQAELGRALGGYVNVVTRSGTNLFGASLYVYGRDDRLNAANALSGERLPMRDVLSGGTVGGPIVRGRTFYFGSLETRRLDQHGLVTIADANAAAINARLAAVGYQGPGVATGLVATPVDTVNALGKIDHQLGVNDQLTVRVGLYDVTGANTRGAGALNTPSASSGLDNRDTSVAVSNVRPIGMSTVLETRAQAAWNTLAALPADPIGPAVSIAGVASFGTLSNSPTGRDNRLVQVVTNVSRMAGAHAIRVGADVVVNDVAIEFPRAVRGAYAFSSLANFLTGTYNNSGFTQTFGATGVSTTNPNLGLYLQDEWKAGRDLTVNAGLRYDLQWLETIHTDRNNVAPRVGVAWTPQGSTRMVIRTSAGLFYDRVPLRALANALLSAGNTTDLSQLRQIGVVLSPSQSAAPVFPAVLPSVVPSTVLPSISTMDRDIQNARSSQVSVELETQVSARAALAVGYERLRGRGLIGSVNQNVPTCASAGANNGCRPVSDYANNGQYSSVGHSSYDALHVSWVLRPSPWGSARVSYTYAKAMNDIGEAFFNGPIDPTDISKDWGRSDNDMRHRLVAAATLRGPDAGRAVWQRLTRGFEVSTFVQIYSAPPFNITSGVTTLQGTAGRPIVDGQSIPRNAGEGSAFVSVGLRVGRSMALGSRVRLEVLAEMFNLTNHTNVLTRNTTFGSGPYPSAPAASFGRVTAVGEPRSGQVGIRLQF